MPSRLSALSPDDRIHLIGVAGSGMSGLASLLLGLGHRVSGSDKVANAETERLRKAGLEFSSPHTAEAVTGARLVVYSSAVKQGNVAYDAAIGDGIELMRRAEALAEIIHQKKAVVIAGTHGKTTTSSMMAHVLRAGGKKPSHYVGAEIPILGTNAHWEPDGEHLVAEGDESDGTLVNFHPEHSVVLNIEADHLDHYSGIEEINEVFRTLLRQTSGASYYCSADAGAAAVCAEFENVRTYGWDAGDDYCATDLRPVGQSTSFTVLKNGEELGVIRLNIPGRHNVLNALGTIALATDLGVTFDKISDALSTFRGARRRFDVKHHSDTFMVVDDYGHHPTEVAATIQTAKSLDPSRVVCLFQPHRYTRTQLLLKEFGTCFAGVDTVLVTDIYAASEAPIPGVDGQLLADEINGSNTGVKATYIGHVKDAHLAAGNALRAGDLFLSLGAGNVHEAATRLTTDLAMFEKIAAVLDESDAVMRLYEPMSRHTTLRVGGPAQFWIEPTTVAGFQRLVRFLREEAIPIRVVGRGSNLLVLDGGIKGAVIHPVRGEFGQVSVDGDQITTGVGARFKKLSAAARGAEIAGFEWMEGIPGNVGGGIRMNAGAMGTETFDQIVSVRFLDLDSELQEKSVGDIVHHYRNVPEFVENYAVSAVFKGVRGEQSTIDELIEKSKAKRKVSQPIAASAGCIFKNPEACPAGKLVEEIGFKNRGVGNVKVSEIHGNFIVNEGGALASEVMELIDQIKVAAKEQRGIELDTEVQIIGEEKEFL